jgi:signal transduction histidine kinase
VTADGVRGHLARHLWWGLVGSVAVGVTVAGVGGWWAARSLLLSQADGALRERLEQPPRLAPLAHGSPGPSASRALLAGPLRRGRLVGMLRVVAPDGTVLVAAEDWPADLELPSDTGVITEQRLADGRRFRCLQAPLPLPPREPPRHRREGRDGRDGDERGWRPPPWPPASASHAEERPWRRPPPGTRLQVAANVDELHADLRWLAAVLALAALLALALALMAAGRLRDALLAPLRRLGAAIDALPDDDPSARLAAGPLPSELAQVARRLDGLLARVAESRVRERRQLAEIAHELRTPLAAARSELGFRRQGDLPAATAARIDDQLLGLGERLDGLLLLGRLEAGVQPCRRETEALTEILDRAWQPWSARARGGGWSLVLDDPDAVEVAADPVLLPVLLGSLIGNAIDHGAPGAIVVTARHGADGMVELRLGNPLAGAAPRPPDDSMAPRDLHCGLGLVLVQRIAAVHGATFTAGPAADGRFVAVLHLPPPGSPGVAAAAG